jgi:hypothetical protein
MNLGKYRADALYRVWGLVWLVVMGVVLQFVVLIGLVWMVVDVLAQLLLNRDFLSSMSGPASVVSAFIRHEAMLLDYTLTGEGEFLWVPEF